MTVQKRKKRGIGFWLIAIAALVWIILPDPIPVVDDLLILFYYFREFTKK